MMTAGLLLLGGCGGISSILVSSYNPSYRPGETVAAGDRLSVYVMGDPFGPAQPGFAPAVLDAMRGKGFSGSAQLVPGAAGQAPPYFVVMVFDPPPGLSEQRVCARPDLITPLPPSPQGRVPLLAVLCSGTRYLTAASGTVAASAGPSDPAFRRGIADFSRALFPPFNPESVPDFGA
ncbi:MAG TPA: hypothetical protein VNT30_21250 [Stellaceae bacterium]|nr:hypothetical protein [Stellaceae bacterium]